MRLKFDAHRKREKKIRELNTDKSQGTTGKNREPWNKQLKQSSNIVLIKAGKVF